MLKHNERRGLCGICSAGCGVVVTFDEGGRMSAVRADEVMTTGPFVSRSFSSPKEGEPDVTNTATKKTAKGKNLLRILIEGSFDISHQLDSVILSGS